MSLPSSACMAASAALSSISTKAKPRGRPVSRSVITLIDSTEPCCSKRLRSSSSVALKGMFPTYNFLPNSISLDAPETSIPSADATLAKIRAGPSEPEIPSETHHRPTLRAIQPYRTQRERQT